MRSAEAGAVPEPSAYQRPGVPPPAGNAAAGLTPSTYSPSAIREG